MLRSLIVLILCTSALAAQEPQLGFSLLHRYTPADYNAPEDNWASAQDSVGVMYFANQSGVLRFDGTSWSRIPVKDGKYVISVAIDSTGRIFVGCTDDFGYLRTGPNGQQSYVSLRHLIKDSTIRFSEVRRIIFQQNGTYFNSFEKIFRYQNDSLFVVRSPELFGFAFGAGDRVFAFVEEHGIMEVIGDSVRAIPGMTRSMLKNRAYTAIPSLHSGVLFGTIDGLLIYNGKTFRRIRTEADSIFTSSRIYHMIRLPDGAIAVAVLGAGVVIMNEQGKLLRQWTKKNGLNSDYTISVFADRQGGLWCTHIPGITRIDYSVPVTLLDERNGIDSYVFNTVQYRGKWYAASLTGLYVQDGLLQKGLPHFRLDPSFGEDCRVLKVVGDELFVGCAKGLFVIGRDGKGKRITDVYSIGLLQSKIDPSIMFVGEYGLTILKRRGTQWNVLTKVKDFSDVLISIEELSDGTLICQVLNSGVVKIRWKNGVTGAPEISHFGIEAGLPTLTLTPANAPSFPLRYSTSAGFFRFDTVASLFRLDSLFTTRCFPPIAIEAVTLYEDKEGGLWNNSFSDTGEIYHRFDRSRNAFIGVPTSLSRFKGKTLQILGEVTNGHIALYSEEGIVLYKKGEKAASIPMPVFISSVSLLNRDTVIVHQVLPLHDADAKQEFLPDENSLRFTLTVPDFSDPAGVQYQIWLDGLEQPDERWQSSNTRDYVQIPAGSYTLRYRARTSSGATTEEFGYRFIIIPQWWQTVWFRAFVLMLLAGLVVFASRRLAARKVQRIRELQRQQEEFSQRLIESQEAERKRIARDIHDGLGQDLIVTKNMVQMLLGNNKRLAKKVAEPLKDLSAVVSNAIESSREIIKSIHPYQLERLGLTESIAMVAANVERTGIKTTVTLEKIDKLFSPEREMHLYRIIQECVTNIQKHSGATRIEMTVQKKDRQVLVRCRDNGKGFDTMSAANGMGLSGMKERARMLGASIEILSTVGNGTEIVLTIPLQPEVK
ncbi:MAG: sensor histidine kinase [Bacteroidota bacterium]